MQPQVEKWGGATTSREPQAASSGLDILYLI